MDNDNDQRDIYAIAIKIILDNTITKVTCYFVWFMFTRSIVKVRCGGAVKSAIFFQWLQVAIAAVYAEGLVVGTWKPHLQLFSLEMENSYKFNYFLTVIAGNK